MIGVTIYTAVSQWSPLMSLHEAQVFLLVSSMSRTLTDLSVFRRIFDALILCLRVRGQSTSGSAEFVGPFVRANQLGRKGDRLETGGRSFQGFPRLTAVMEHLLHAPCSTSRANKGLPGLPGDGPMDRWHPIHAPRIQTRLGCEAHRFKGPQARARGFESRGRRVLVSVLCREFM